MQHHATAASSAEAGALPKSPVPLLPQLLLPLLKLTQANLCVSDSIAQQPSWPSIPVAKGAYLRGKCQQLALKSCKEAGSA